MDHNGKRAERKFYAGAHPEYLAPYVGKRVKLIGKAVETARQRQSHTRKYWPALLEVAARGGCSRPRRFPRKSIFLIDNKVYMADPAPEKAFVGRLQKKKGVDVVGYRLLVETGDTITPEDVHLYDRDYNRLAPTTV